MFIAVINENFNVAEESKRGHQADNYFQAQHLAEQARSSWLRRLNPYRWFKPSPKAIIVENLSNNLVLSMRKALVADYVIPMSDRDEKSKVCLYP